MEPEEPLGVERRLEEDLAARMPPLTMSSSCNKRRKEKGERLLNVSGASRGDKKSCPAMVLMESHS